MNDVLFLLPNKCSSEKCPKRRKHVCWGLKRRYPLCTKAFFILSSIFLSCSFFIPCHHKHVTHTSSSWHVLWNTGWFMTGKDTGCISYQFELVRSMRSIKIWYITGFLKVPLIKSDNVYTMYLPTSVQRTSTSLVPRTLSSVCFSSSTFVTRCTTFHKFKLFLEGFQALITKFYNSVCAGMLENVHASRSL